MAGFEILRKNSFQRLMDKGWKRKGPKFGNDAVQCCRLTAVTLQHDGDQGRRVLHGLDLMRGLGWQKQQLSCAQRLMVPVLAEGELAFQTLNRHLPRNLVHRQALARHQHETDHFQAFRLEKRAGFLTLQRSTKGLHRDRNTGLGMVQGHGFSSFSAAS